MAESMVERQRWALDTLLRTVTRLETALERRNPTTADAAFRELADIGSACPPRRAEVDEALDAVLTGLGRRLDIGDENSLDVGVDALRILLDASRSTAPDDRAGVFLAAADQLLERQRGRHTRVLSAAIRLAEDAMRAAQRESAMYGAAAWSLGEALLLGWQRHRDPDLLERSVDQLRVAARILSGTEAAASCDDALLRALIELYRCTGDGGALDEAITVGQSALGARPPEGHERFPTLSGLATALNERYMSANRRADLRTAIGLLREAVGIGDRHGLRQDAELSMLADLLNASFDLTEDVRNLEDAVRLKTQAAEHTPAGDPEEAERLHGLGLVLIRFFNATGEVESLERADAAFRAAIDAATDPEQQATSRIRLAHVLADRFTADGGVPEHLDAAIQQAEAALVMLPDEHPLAEQTAGVLDRLLADRDRFRALQAERGLAELSASAGAPPSSVNERDIARLAENHPERGRLLVLFAMDLLDGVTPSDRRSRERASAALAEALAVRSTMPAWLQAVAARLQLDVSAELRNWKAAAHAGALAVGLLAGLERGDLARGEEEHRLVTFAGLGADAAASLVHAGMPAVDALDVFDRGRAILLGHMLDQRCDVAVKEPASGEDEAAGLGRGGGIVVGMVVSRYGSHALLDGPEGSAAVPLPDLTERELNARALAFTAAIDLLEDGRHDPADRWAAARVLDRTLEWLWDVAVEPVLAGLPPRAPRAPLHRLYWVPSGLLTLLPLHAAGHHLGQSGRSTFDHAVTSYAPTVRALRRAARRPPPENAPRPLAVAVADAPGQPVLRHVLSEAELVREALAGVESLVDGAATTKAVQSALSRHDWVHLACRAVVDTAHSSAAHLVLADGRLRLADVAAARHPESHMAYLSACAAMPGRPEAADEPVHVASAVQLAGYRHVVATLWPVPGDVALEVARWTYQTAPAWLPGDGPAWALHRVVTKLRERHGGRSPYLWAGHVHVGP